MYKYGLGQYMGLPAEFSLSVTRFWSNISLFLKILDLILEVDFSLIHRQRKTQNDKS